MACNRKKKSGNKAEHATNIVSLITAIIDLGGREPSPRNQRLPQKTLNVNHMDTIIIILCIISIILSVVAIVLNVRGLIRHGRTKD